MSATAQPALHPDGVDRWRIDPVGAMRVPGIVYASEALMPHVLEEEALQQVVNVATLPGIVSASYAMPDVHWGYGFPIGGVAATDVEAGGVVSPGGVGFDISCGVRLLVSPLDADELAPHLAGVMDQLAARVPTGLGAGGVVTLADGRQLDAVLRHGASEVVAQGLGTDADLARCDVGDVGVEADPSAVSARARTRGWRQIGSLGSGNHFLEVQVVDAVADSPTARALGLHVGQVCVMIHCGSRGLGHQVCSDHVLAMREAMRRFGIEVPDAQLACAPVRSPQGAAYLGAMAAAANYGRANRQALTAAARAAFAAAAPSGELAVLYDVSHNLASLEWHEVEGRRRLVCVHRKGATRALGPGHPELPEDLRPVGQPVFVPGSMGTASHVLVGVSPGGAFSSTCHGAGRTLSRHAAVRRISGEAVRRELEDRGIAVRAASARGLAEEAPFAYKDVDEVVATCERAGLARRVARLRPLGVVKG
ncbi:MAG TPA: RtcB family protein [Acidimicrobiales bacterium]|nr:RtcB family protein [Acidimicrobiales bacterium]